MPQLNRSNFNFFRSSIWVVGVSSGIKIMKSMPSDALKKAADHLTANKQPASVCMSSFLGNALLRVEVTLPSASHENADTFSSAMRKRRIQ